VKTEVTVSNFSGGPMIRPLPLQGAWVRFPVRDLRSHVCCSAAIKKKVVMNLMKTVSDQLLIFWIPMDY